MADVEWMCVFFQVVYKPVDRWVSVVSLLSSYAIAISDNISHGFLSLILHCSDYCILYLPSGAQTEKERSMKGTDQVLHSSSFAQNVDCSSVQVLCFFNICMSSASTEKGCLHWRVHVLDLVCSFFFLVLGACSLLSAFDIRHYTDDWWVYKEILNMVFNYLIYDFRPRWLEEMYKPWIFSY